MNTHEHPRDNPPSDGVAILVAAPGSPKRSVRINVTLPEDVLVEIDRHAREHGMTRAGFLARAARQSMHREEA